MASEQATIFSCDAPGCAQRVQDEPGQTMIPVGWFAVSTARVTPLREATPAEIGMVCCAVCAQAWLARKLEELSPPVAGSNRGGSR